MALKEAIYVHCLSNKVVKNGKSLTGEQRNKWALPQISTSLPISIN
ncbi:hypothetical protein [Legionella sainthelensi]|nr:hypothetical protein [Legionella sainthelensi]